MRSKVFGIGRAIGVPLALLLAALGCRSTHAWPETEDRTIRVADGADFTAPSVEVTQFSTVCFWNGGASTSGTLKIVLARPVDPSLPCRTTVGFVRCADRSACQAEIAPAKCAFICFHDPGRFRYDLTRGDRTVTGEIIVKEGSGP